MLKIGIIHGPNLNRLGERKEKCYGTLTLEEINERLEEFARQRDIQLEITQTNHEGEIVDTIQSFSRRVNGIVINPGAYTHYSFAIRDALEDCSLPIIEVHISNVFSREQFRTSSVTAPACTGQIVGFGYLGYILAIEGLQNIINKEKMTYKVKVKEFCCEGGE
ncbi:MAG: type II 3-dehydroquinate dehydratase [Atribacterota bacterium]|jgi:3-dehydroquinate dehydratase-2|nr:type II 3-dehydroquinate dehydratase [Atribacterota bacterium]MDD5497215.1 type II 3-dehydroquinate dehydratase [Atribacterota bacterium]